jgi:hypothetical protein
MEAATLAGKGTGRTDELPFSLFLELNVTDAEVIGELCQRQEGQERDQYALAALRVGVLAFRQARGQVDSQALKREGDRLLASVASALAAHQSHLDSTLAKTLQDYFDPTSGRFNERIDRLLKKDGELEMLLARKITAENSEMSAVLSRQVGHGSPLFRLLSPNESEGLLSALRKGVNEELERQRLRVLAEFSLDNEQGALRRLCGQLQTSNGELRTNLKEQIDGLLKQFSFDDEQSALSRMAKTVNTTNDAIASHLTLDSENSALSRLKRELFTVLKAHGEAAQKFQEDVRATLAGMQARREADAASTRHGLDFESQVGAMVHSEAQRLKDVATFVAKTPGRISRCLVGDVLVELGTESCAPGARIVIEAKAEQGYTLKQALQEIETARQNRDAETGLFVFSKKIAPANLEPISRYGQDLVVVWDAEDPASDSCLKLALSAVRAISIGKSKVREEQAADFSAMDKAIFEINKQVDALDEIRTLSTTIQNNSGKILERLRISSDKLRAQIDELSDRLGDVKQASSST